MRVALVWFNANAPPGVSHGLLVLARELVDAGHQVRHLHLNEQLGEAATDEQLLEALLEFRPEIAALSFTSIHAEQARNLAALLREKLPACLLVAGGIHATLDPEGVFSWPEIDAVGIGELDGGPWREFVNALARGGRYFLQQGFWVRHERREYRNRLAPLPDLTRQPLPWWEGVDTARLVAAKRGFIEVLAGRGCPHRCRFCQNHAVVERYRASLGGGPGSWPYCRLRRVEDLMAEIELQRRLAPAAQAVMFADDHLAIDRDWLRELAQVYPRRVALPFVANAAAGQLDRDKVELLARAGCNMLKFGVECAPGPLRRRTLGRPESESQLRRAFALCRAQGINTMGYMMIGIPGQEASDLLASCDFFAELLPDAVRVAVFCPFPGTELYQQLLAGGMLRAGEPLAGFRAESVLPFPAELHLLIEKFLYGCHWLMNARLGGEVGQRSAALCRQLLDAPVAQWQDPAFRGNWRQRAELLASEFIERGLPHYQAPFPERPDWFFLRTRRSRPLINVEQQP